MRTFAATNLPLTISQLLIRVRVSNDSVVRALFYYKHGIEYSLFVLLIFLLHLVLKHGRKVKKSIKQTKNAPFYIGSGNEPFKLAILGGNLPSTIRHQPMLITIINMYIVVKKKMSLFIRCMLNDNEIHKKKANTRIN